MDVPISGALFLRISSCSSTFGGPDGCKVRVLVSFLQLVTLWCRSISDHKPERLQLYCVEHAKLGTAAKPTKCSHKKLEDVLLRCTLARESARSPPPPASKSFFPRVAVKRDALRIKGVPAANHGTQKFRPLCSERGACGFDSFHQEPMGSVDERHGSLR